MVAEIEKIFETLAERDTEFAGRFKTLEGEYASLRRLFKSGAFETAKSEPTKAEENLGLCLLGGVLKNKTALGELETRGIETKALTESTTSTGGALVPEALHGEVIDLLANYGVFRRNARVVQMSAQVDSFPKIDSDVTVYCPGEGGSITDSDISLSNVSLTSKKLAVLLKMSSELNEDSVTTVASMVGRSMARAMAAKEDAIGYLGTGTSAYFGMTGITGAFHNLTSWDAQSANAVLGGLVTAAGNAYSEITLANFRQVVAVLPEQYETDAAWYVSKKFFWNVIVPLVWAESSGAPTIGTPSFYFAEGAMPYFLGYPVRYTSVMPSTEANSQICAIFGDLSSGAYLGERRNFTLDTDASVFFANDQIGIRATERIATNVFGVGDTTDAGPICALVTLAS